MNSPSTTSYTIIEIPANETAIVNENRATFTEQQLPHLKLKEQQANTIVFAIPSVLLSSDCCIAAVCLEFSPLYSSKYKKFHYVLFGIVLRNHFQITNH